MKTLILLCLCVSLVICTIDPTPDSNITIGTCKCCANGRFNDNVVMGGPVLQDILYIQDILVAATSSSLYVYSLEPELELIQTVVYYLSGNLQ